METTTTTDELINVEMLRLSDNNIQEATAEELYELILLGHPDEEGYTVTRNAVQREWERRGGKLITEELKLPTANNYPYINRHTGCIQTLEKILDKNSNADWWWSVHEHWFPVTNFDEALRILEKQLSVEKAKPLKAKSNKKYDSEGKYYSEFSAKGIKESMACINNYLKSQLTETTAKKKTSSRLMVDALPAIYEFEADPPPGPPYVWNDVDICLNPNLLTIYKSKKCVTEVRTAQDEETGKWYIGYDTHCFNGGSSCGAGKGEYRESFESREAAILHQIKSFKITKTECTDKKHREAIEKTIAEYEKLVLQNTKPSTTPAKSAIQYKWKEGKCSNPSTFIVYNADGVVLTVGIAYNKSEKAWFVSSHQKFPSGNQINPLEVEIHPIGGYDFEDAWYSEVQNLLEWTLWQVENKDLPQEIFERVRTQCNALLEPKLKNENEVENLLQKLHTKATTEVSPQVSPIENNRRANDVASWKEVFKYSKKEFSCSVSIGKHEDKFCTKYNYHFKPGSEGGGSKGNAITSGFIYTDRTAALKATRDEMNKDIVSKFNRFNNYDWIKAFNEAIRNVKPSTKAKAKPAPKVKPEPAPIVKQVDGLQQIQLFEVEEQKQPRNPDAELFGYIAKDKGDRQRFKRKKDGFIEKLSELPALERNALLRALNSKFTPPHF